MGRRDRERKERIQAGQEMSRRQEAAVMERQTPTPGGLLCLRSVKRQAARKVHLCECPHQCGPCGRVIEPGQEYVRLVAIDEAANSGRGRYITIKLCLECDSPKNPNVRN